MMLDVAGFHALSEECRAEGLAWIELVVGPDEWSQEVVANPDGSWDIYVIIKDENGDPKLNDEGDDVVRRVVTTQSAPPPCIQAAMV